MAFLLLAMYLVPLPLLLPGNFTWPAGIAFLPRPGIRGLAQWGLLCESPPSQCGCLKTPASHCPPPGTSFITHCPLPPFSKA